MRFFQEASITPTTVLAGDSVQFTIRLVAGRMFSAAGTRLMLDLPAYLGTSRPTCFEQEMNGYMEVCCSNPDLRYNKRVWDMEIMDFPTRQKTSFQGMAARIFVLDFLGGQAADGDEVLIHWGWTRVGFGGGTKVSIVVPEPDFHNTVHVRYFLDGTKGLPDLARSFQGYDRPAPDEEIALRFRVQPREPERLRVVRRKDGASVLALDRFSNVCPDADFSKLVVEALPGNRNELGVIEVGDPAVRVTSRGLPLDDSPDPRNVFQDYHVFFGDLHTHSSHSNDCIEREKQEMNPYRLFRYARQTAGLDFCAVTDHHQPWDEERNKIGEAQWGALCEAVDKLHDPGRFVTFAGFEYRCIRGDTAVVLGEPMSYSDIDLPDAKNVAILWEELRGRNYITIPHFHNRGGMAEGEWFACPYEGVEPVLEIYSCHGSYERDDVLERHISEIKPFRPDRHGKYFLQKGLRYGYVCNSDGHKGHVGTDGLTAVFAKDLTREAIFEAIRARRCYGTTNARIRLVFTINGQLMGSVLRTAPEKIARISVAGERRFKAVDVFRNGELFRRFRPDTDPFEVEFDLQTPATSNWYVRATQVDNHIAYSSPIWVE